MSSKEATKIQMEAQLTLLKEFLEEIVPRCKNILCLPHIDWDVSSQEKSSLFPDLLELAFDLIEISIPLRLKCEEIMIHLEKEGENTK